MAESLFHVGTGLNIADEAHLIYGSANPTAGVAAPVGSLFAQTTDGSIWHKVDAGDTDWNKLVDSAGASVEDGYQNTFMGKAAIGSTTPTYTNEYHVTDGDSLMAAISKLDTEIGAAITGQEVRTYGPISDQAVNDNIKALDNAIGSDAEQASSVFATVNASINTKISELDAALNDSEPKKVSATNQTTPTNLVMDSVPVSTISTVEWLVTVKSTTTGANRKTYKLIAVNDGTVTDVDWTKYAILKTGANIAGLSIDVVGATGNMELRVSASENVDYNVSRITLA